MRNLAPLLGKLEKTLVGAERLAPEVQKSVSKYITPSGRIIEDSLKNRAKGLNLLLGQKGGLNVIKSRFRQGGILGPGGLFLGDLALDPNYKQLLTNLKNSKGFNYVIDPKTGKSITKRKAVAKVLGGGIIEGMNPAFGIGFPILDAKAALDSPDYEEGGGYSGLLGALGSGIGFAAGGPLGLIGGMAAGELGGGIGRTLGGMFDPSKPLVDLSGKTMHTVPRPSDYILDAAIPHQYT